MKESLLISQQISQLIHDRVKEIERQCPELFTAFGIKSFTAVETGVHPRVLADWNKRELLLAPRKENKHHRLSLTEFTWILMLERMRAFGLSYDIIKVFKEDFLVAEELDIQMVLNSPELLKMISTALGESASNALRVFVDNPQAKEFLKTFMPVTSILDGILALSFLIAEPVALHIDENGKGLTFFPSLFRFQGIDRVQLDRALFSTHFSINLTDLVAQALGKAPMDKVCGELKLLSPNEAAVIESLRTEKVKSVTVRLNDGGEVDFLELTTVEHADRGTRLLELMLRDGYHEITVKTERGKVVHCENTRKIKFK